MLFTSGYNAYFADRMQLIEFTPAALEAIQKYKSTLQIPEGYLLRVGIRQKNAQDKGLIIGFDQLGPNDRRETVSGIELMYQAGQVFFFAGMVIDYQEKDGRSGFRLLEKKHLEPNSAS